MKKTCIIACGLICANVAIGSTTYYVNAARPHDDGDGLSWAEAKQTIQAAIDLADDDALVIVTNGLYAAGGRAGYPAGSPVTNRVAIYRPITVQAFSSNPADTIIQGAPDPATGGFGAAAVRGVYMINGSTLSGFTVTNGYTHDATAASLEYRRGGGIHCPVGHYPTITNCIIAGNHAEQRAGGVYYGNVYHSTLSGNSAGHSGGATR